jgi:ParB-like chromosome segregation protein Spo0J
MKNNEIATKRVKISDIKPNPSNPRLIKDDKFKKLVKSVQDFPEMLELRPVVVNTDMVILGGNMRWKACKEAGLKEIPVLIASGLTPEQEREFIIKDNVSGGEWDWEMLGIEWNADELEEWGMDLPKNLYEELDDLSDKLVEKYLIEIECEDETRQEQVYNKLIGEGYKCRLLTL